MEEKLIQLGLSANEAKIYLAAQGMLVFSAGAIAARARIKRSTTYLALSSLIARGLISEIYQHKKKLFRAEGPDRLERLTMRMKRKAQEAENLVKELIPTLMNIQDPTSETPRVAFYAGVEGIKNVWLDIASSSQSWYFFGSSIALLKKISQDDLREILEEGSKNRRQSGRPKIYFITDQGMIHMKEFSQPDPKFREVKLLPETIRAGSGLIMSEDKLVLISIEPTFAVVIQSKKITEMIKIMYKLTWASLGEKTY